MKKQFCFNSPGRDELQLKIELCDNNITSCEIKATGCLDFLQTCQSYKKKLIGPVEALTLPKDIDHSHIIWREMILRIQDKWQLPVDAEEICHCRKINTSTVDLEIVYGAHDPETIRKKTSANTGCGTCLGDIEKLIENRIKII